MLLYAKAVETYKTRRRLSAVNKPRILFAGGGSEQDSRPLDEIFASWVGSKGRLLYLPVALVDEPSMQAGIRWVKSVFEPLGLTQIDAWTDLSGKTAQDLQSYDGVYIGGGNTFHLLNQVRVHHLDRALVDFIVAGLPCLRRQRRGHFTQP
ncbi:MAG: hypothetical protein EHM21_19120 [Chloroflexi bacterium]|nr:MAG: hypothetical protein EHM21_19120 [Chloroflexota bacterium]